MISNDVTPLQKAIADYQKPGLHFKPDANFYKQVGINRKRFGQLVKGQKPILYVEARALADYFGIPVTDVV